TWQPSKNLNKNNCTTQKSEQKYSQQNDTIISNICKPINNKKERKKKEKQKAVKATKTAPHAHEAKKTKTHNAHQNKNSNNIKSTCKRQ
ncbi:hypothetical protein ACQWF0_24320, partial [Salmonella enterica subsp. enterica serovar Infantis]